MATTTPVDVLTLDVQIILIGQKMSDLPCHQHHRDLLNAFLSNLFLALDDGGHVKQLYENRLGSSSPGKKWLTALAIKNRIRFFPLGKIPRPMKAKLDNEHFDWSDGKYVQLAMATPDKHFVTEDDDFTAKIQVIIREHVGVIVHDTIAACRLVGIACPD